MSDVTGMKMRTRACAALAVLALSATACGGVDGATTTAADETSAEVTSSTTVAQERAAVESTSAPAVSAAVDAPTAAVLAYAIEAAESQSYSFEQGMSIDINLLGETLNGSSNGPLARGVVSGDDQQITTDLGGFMSSMFESLGVEANDPALGGAFDPELFTMDSWLVDGTLVLDLSNVANISGQSALASAEELAIFADGPVSIDLEQLRALGVEGDVSGSDLMSQFSQGAQVTNPASIVEALRSVDSLIEVGNQEQNGIEVTVYEANITLAEYAAALGQNIEDSAGSFGDLGGFDPAVFAPLLTDVDVALEVSLDGEGLVRQLTSTIDMGAFIEGLLSSGSEAGDLGEITLVVETWQTFDNYGEGVDIAVPDAVDATTEIASLLNS